MGLNILLSNSSSYQQNNINPNPNNFKIKAVIEGNKGYILKVRYINCTNYEGNKILLFKGVPNIDIKYLDPHFTENNNLIGRFAPTEEGLQLAVQTLKQFDNN